MSSSPTSRTYLTLGKKKKKPQQVSVCNNVFPKNLRNRVGGKNPKETNTPPSLNLRCSGALGCVSTSCQYERTSAMPSEKQQLLLSDLQRVIRPSPNYLKFTLLQREGLFPKGGLQTFANLPRSGHPGKISPRTDRLLRDIKEKLKRNIM